MLTFYVRAAYIAVRCGIILQQRIVPVSNGRAGVTDRLSSILAAIREIAQDQPVCCRCTNEAKLLADPSISTADRREASIKIVQKIPIIATAPSTYPKFHAVSSIAA